MLDVVRIQLCGRYPLQGKELRADFVDQQDTLVLDARCLERASPLELAAMVSMGTWAANEGRDVALLLPYDENVASYLTRMNVIEYLAPIAKIDGTVVEQTRRDHSATLLEVTTVTSANGHKVAATLGGMAVEQLGDDLGAAAFKCLGELIENATTHGWSSTGAFTAAQLYTGASTGRPGFEFAVCDSGVGILENLRASVRHQNLVDGPAALERALRWALRDEIASTPGGRGYGLGNLSNHASRSRGGRLMLRSGDAFATVDLDGGRPKLCSSVATAIDGTWAWLRVRLP